MNSLDHEIIHLAWDDGTSFDMLEKQTGYSEAQVIELMRRELKPRSYRVWRQRVSGRKAKHLAKLRAKPLKTSSFLESLIPYKI